MWRPPLRAAVAAGPRCTAGDLAARPAAASLLSTHAGQRPPQVLAEALVPCRVAGERVAHLAHAALQGGQPGGARQQQACVVITPASECGVSLQCSWSISRNERNGLRIQWIQLNAAECASSQSACWRTGICPPEQHASRGAVVLDPSGEGPPRAERRRHELGVEQRDAAGAKRVVDALRLEVQRCEPHGIQKCKAQCAWVRANLHGRGMDSRVRSWRGRVSPNGTERTLRASTAPAARS